MSPGQLSLAGPGLSLQTALSIGLREADTGDANRSTPQPIYHRPANLSNGPLTAEGPTSALSRQFGQNPLVMVHSATMHDVLQARLDAGAEAWTRYNQLPLGRIRCDVTGHNLLPHLPAIVDGEHPPQVLDAGGGSGELALQLVRQGYCVCLLDCAPAMLKLARQAADTLPPELRTRLSTCLMRVEDAHRHFASGSFDAVTCHTLIEYLPEPHATLRGLVSLVRDGGLLSISFVNRHSEVLRRVWLQTDPAGALASLDHTTFHAALFHLEGTAYTADEIEAWLSDMGLTVIARRGVRIFADYLPRERLEDPAFFEAVLRLEKEVAERPPYLSLARYGHLIARKAAPAAPWKGSP